ncbi:MAG: hypothetical protein RIM80_11210, partial [Alphaproteobacteria bacterium]
GATVGLAMIDVAIDRLRQVGNARSEVLALAVRRQLRVVALRRDAAAAAALADRAELVDLLQLSQALRHAAPSAADDFDAALTRPPTAP